jgi:hypothetical protein
LSSSEIFGIELKGNHWLLVPAWQKPFLAGVSVDSIDEECRIRKSPRRQPGIAARLAASALGKREIEKPK